MRQSIYNHISKNYMNSPRVVALFNKKKETLQCSNSSHKMYCGNMLWPSGGEVVTKPITRNFVVSITPPWDTLNIYDESTVVTIELDLPSSARSAGIALCSKDGLEIVDFFTLPVNENKIVVEFKLYDTGNYKIFYKNANQTFTTEETYPIGPYIKITPVDKYYIQGANITLQFDTTFEENLYDLLEYVGIKQDSNLPVEMTFSFDASNNKLTVQGNASQLTGKFKLFFRINSNEFSPETMFIYILPLSSDIIYEETPAWSQGVIPENHRVNVKLQFENDSSKTCKGGIVRIINNEITHFYWETEDYSLKPNPKLNLTSYPNGTYLYIVQARVQYDTDPSDFDQITKLSDSLMTIHI